MNDDEFDDYWVQSPKTVQAPTQPALQIETIDGVEPLDAQLGVTEFKTVPDALYEPLFGQPDDTNLHTYAILDAAKVPNLPELLEVSGLEHRCLFKGDAYDELKDVAPWIVQLEDENNFTRNLFTRSDAPWHVWDNEPGIYLRSGGTLDDMWKHFRKFTRIQEENGKWVYFRFWDVKLSSEYWSHFATSTERVTRFFHGRDGSQSYSVGLLIQGSFKWLRPSLNSLPQLSIMKEAFAFNKADFTFFQSQIDLRLKKEVAARLNFELADAPNTMRFKIIDVVEVAFKFIKERSDRRPITSDACFSLSFLIIIWGDFASAVLSGPIFSERLLPIGHRIKLAQVTYFVTVRKLVSEGN